MNQTPLPMMGLSHSRIISLYMHTNGLCSAIGLDLTFDDIEFSVCKHIPEAEKNNDQNLKRSLYTSRFIEEMETFVRGYRIGRDNAIKDYIKMD